MRETTVTMGMVPRDSVSDSVKCGSWLLHLRNRKIASLLLSQASSNVSLNDYQLQHSSIQAFLSSWLCYPQTSSSIVIISLFGALKCRARDI